MSTTCVGAPSAGGAVRRQPERRRRVDARAERARATSSRERSSAWMCGSIWIAWSTSQRAGASWLAPSVRLARP